MQELYPAYPRSAPVAEPVMSRCGEPIVPAVSHYDRQRIEQLGVPLRSVRACMEEGLAYLKERGEL